MTGIEVLPVNRLTIAIEASGGTIRAERSSPYDPLGTLADRTCTIGGSSWIGSYKSGADCVDLDTCIF